MQRRAKVVLGVSFTVAAILFASLLSTLVLGVAYAIQFGIGLALIIALLMSGIFFPRYYWHEFMTWLREGSYDPITGSRTSAFSVFGPVVALIAVWGFLVWFFHYR
jgi:uncharacterized membrane protein